MKTLEADEKDGGDLQAFVKLLRYARPHWGRLAAAAIVLTVASFAGILSATFLGKLVDEGLVKRNAHAALKWGFIVIAAEAAALATTYVGRRSMASAANAALLIIREKLFTHLNRLPMSYFDRVPLGRTVMRLTYDVENLEEFFSSTLARLLNATFTVALVVVGMLLTEPKLGLLITVAMLPAVWVTWATRNSVRHWNREFSRRNSAINAKLSEFLNGLAVIRYFGVEKWSKESFDDTVDHHLEAAIRINVLNARIRPLVLVLVAIPMLLLLYFGGKAVLAGTLAMGVFIAFLRYTERYSRPITAIAQEIQTIQTAFTAAERVGRFLEASTENVTLGADGSVAPARLQGAIEFKDVRMRYSEKAPWALDGVSFALPPGARVGLAGRTGSGKSTIASLLCRLYEFQEGEILLDGVSARNYSREALRSQIGLVTQDVTMFKGTLRENLSFGLEKTDEELRAVMASLGLFRLTQRRGLDLDGVVLDQGANLSAGERQLIALARILLRDPSILILDEATSNIDEECEALLQDAVLKVMNGRTCLLIAHRLRTLEACDRVLVFRDGKLNEDGSHETLLKNPQGYYARLLAESSAVAGADVPRVGLTRV